MRIIILIKLFIAMVALYSCTSHDLKSKTTTTTSDTIPITIRPQGIFIPCSIGKDTILFLFDTGTSRTTITTVSDTSSYIGENNVYDINGNRKRLKAFPAKIKIGSIIDTTVVLLHNKPIIGMSTISKYSWHFDFKSKIVIVSDKEYTLNNPSKNTNILYFEDQKKSQAKSIITSLILSDGTKKRIIVDTGSANILTVKTNQYHENADFTAYTLESSGAFSGRRTDTLSCAIKDLAIGKEVFSNILIQYSKAGKRNIDGNMGLPILNSFEQFIICPFTKRLILIKRYGSYQSPEFRTYQFIEIFYWGFREKKKQIAGVIAGSDFNTAGIKIGDTLITSKRKGKTLDCSILSDGEISKISGCSYFSQKQIMLYLPYFGHPFNMSAHITIDQYIEHCDSIIYNAEKDKYIHYFKAPFQYSYPLQDSVNIKILAN